MPGLSPGQPDGRSVGGEGRRRYDSSFRPQQLRSGWPQFVINFRKHPVTRPPNKSLLLINISPAHHCRRISHLSIQRFRHVTSDLLECNKVIDKCLSSTIVSNIVCHNVFIKEIEDRNSSKENLI